MIYFPTVETFSNKKEEEQALFVLQALALLIGNTHKDPLCLNYFQDW